MHKLQGLRVVGGKGVRGQGKGHMARTLFGT